jgi:hypothetical protein
MACSGNSTELCGGVNALNVYWNGLIPVIPQTVGTWEYTGCFSYVLNYLVGVVSAHTLFSDTVSSRALPHLETISGGVTIESCTAACKANGFGVAGLEVGRECCGSRFINIVF